MNIVKKMRILIEKINTLMYIKTILMCNIDEEIYDQYRPQTRRVAGEMCKDKKMTRMQLTELRPYVSATPDLPRAGPHLRSPEP